MSAKTILLIMTASLGFWAQGCLKHTVQTKVNADGTCERVIKLYPGAKGIPSTPFPIPRDASWDTTWTQTSAKEYVLTMKKKFASCEELSREYAHPADSGTFPLHVNVTREFRWFYTYYSYAESYGRFTSYTLVKPEAVLSEEEITRFTYGDESDTLKNKVAEWEMRNLFEEIYTSLSHGAASLNGSTLTPELLAAHKEELFRTIVGYRGPGEKLGDPDSVMKAQSSYRGTKGKLFDSTTVGEKGVNAFAEIAARLLGNEDVWKLKDSIRGGWAAAQRMAMSNPMHGEEFTNTVELPGILLETNAKDVKGSDASWSFTIERLSLRNLDMLATSREVNVWAFAVTGVVALGLLALLVLPLLRKHARS